MKRIQIVVLCLALLAGVCAGCADREAETVPERKYADGSIVLRVGTSSRMRTRTALAGSYNLHHVRQVYAILYQGEGDNATYVCHKNLDWSPKDSTDYGEGVVQEKAFELAVPHTLQSGSKCTLLCVGLDDRSGTTYGLTLDADHTPSFCAAGQTLSEAKAILADGQSTKYSELFAGWDTLTYQRKDTTAVSVELTRRVAGAYAYLKDIPVTVNGTDVKAIQWVLGNSPTTQIGLARKRRDDNGTLPTDFGSGSNTATDALVLDKLTLTDIATANTSTNLYEISEDYTKPLGLSANTLLLSAYLLPMAAGDADYTLAVQLLDTDGTVIKTFPAQWSNAPTAAGDKDKYAIYPNYVYHAGTRSEESDRPASLAGYRIELVVQPWTEVKIETEFPKVPLEATIDYDKNPSSYIYDCINTTDKITIMPSLMQKKWRLTLVAEDQDGNEDLTGTCDWIYFVKSDGSYTQTLSSSDYTDGNSKAVEVTIRLCDYINPHYTDNGKTYAYADGYDPSTAAGRAAINSDWRRARIVITTDNSSSPSHISIRQYNAITVIGQYDKSTPFACGFSRYDYDVERDKNGTITNNGHQGKWGFVKQSNTALYSGFANAGKLYYDGYYAHEKIESKWTADANYWGTEGDISTQPIIRYSWTDSWVWKGNKREQELLYWYLPSQYELYSFFSDMAIRQLALDTPLETHIAIDGLYWSSSSKYNSLSLNTHRTYCQKLEEGGTLWISNSSDGEVGTRALRYDTTLGYSRRARHFNGYVYVQ